MSHIRYMLVLVVHLTIIVDKDRAHPEIVHDGWMFFLLAVVRGHICN